MEAWRPALRSEIISVDLWSVHDSYYTYKFHLCVDELSFVEGIRKVEVIAEKVNVRAKFGFLPKQFWIIFLQRILLLSLYANFSSSKYSK